MDKELLEIVNDLIDIDEEKGKTIRQGLAETTDPETKKIYELLLDELKKEKEFSEDLLKNIENPVDTRM